VKVITEQLVTAAALAQERGVSLQTVYSWIHRYPDFPANVSGSERWLLWPRGEVDAWLAKHPMVGTPARTRGGR
jgi:predicted DNA-binding transcriptional regulator AlpA